MDNVEKKSYKVLILISLHGKKKVCYKGFDASTLLAKAYLFRKSVELSIARKDKRPRGKLKPSLPTSCFQALIYYSIETVRIFRQPQDFFFSLSASFFFYQHLTDYRASTFSYKLSHILIPHGAFPLWPAIRFSSPIFINGRIELPISQKCPREYKEDIIRRRQNKFQIHCYVEPPPKVEPVTWDHYYIILL